MVDKMTRRNTERGRPQRRTSERPLAPELPSPYSNDNATPNFFDGNTAPRQEPRSRLELLEEALQDRVQPQDSIGELEEVADEIFEDADDCSISSSRPASPTEQDWEEVESDIPSSPDLLSV
ncbi:hypothetical protein Alg130_07045, partial [Pyrenophora tritici-repentis]